MLKRQQTVESKLNMRCTLATTTMTSITLKLCKTTQIDSRIATPRSVSHTTNQDKRQLLIATVKVDLAVEKEAHHLTKRVSKTSAAREAPRKEGQGTNKVQISK